MVVTFFADLEDLLANKVTVARRGFAPTEKLNCFALVKPPGHTTNHAPLE
jgi:hypothetical protein